MIGRRLEVARTWHLRSSFLWEGHVLEVRDVRIETAGIAGRLVEISKQLESGNVSNPGFKAYDLAQYSDLLCALGDGNVWWIGTCEIARNCRVFQGS